jgi:branched-subunit amino acid aminotransferase/4-amino-4-deoxychorismate lyase
VFEGLSSNFLAVVDGTVFTAGKGVLKGTIRDMIIKICKKNGIPLQETPPNVADIGRWQGCIVSSTSRLSLPVAQVQVCNDHDGAALKVYDLPTHGIVATIDQLVLDAIDAASEPL